MRIQIHKLNAHLFEGTMAEQMSLDSGKGLVRIIVCLLDQSKLFSLGLVKA